MELIANLESTQTTKTLTPENLDRMEHIFKQAVGNDKEIDLENFKKIVQSKNMFFVERIFHVFDADKSGTISLEEFMRVMRDFAEQSPAEKLQYLFNVYDINNDGSIQFDELWSVINECMKENGLKFHKEEIDELTRMLFDDADTDGSGCINFTEFKNQLAKQPAFIENIACSMERWLLPPMEKQDRKGSRPFCNLPFLRKISWRYIRNNWTNVLYVLVFFAINLVLFATRAYQYRDHNIYVILARACGQCLNFNCAFIIVLVLRQTLTWMRTHGFSQYLPIDNHIYYHKLAGYIILFYSVLHTIMHIVNFSVIAKEKNVPLHELLFSTSIGLGFVSGAACLTGWILLFVLVVMSISAMPFVRRNGKFEIFYCLHTLGYVFWICLILHGPSFWKWFLGPAVLFSIESAVRICRSFSNAKLAYVQQGVLLPSKVTQLVIKRPPKFDYRPGDYVYVNIPAIAKFEWHPFTISSAPELDDVLWLHIRGVGEWTNSLYNYFQKEDQEAVLSDELAKNLDDLPEYIRNKAKLEPPRTGGIFSTTSESPAITAKLEPPRTGGIFSTTSESPAITAKHYSMLLSRKQDLRGVGEWTNSLYNYLQKEEEAVPSDELAKNLDVFPDFTINKVKSEPPSTRGIFSATSEGPAITDENYSMLLSEKLDTAFLDSSSLTENGSVKGIPQTNSVSSSFRDALDDTFTNPSFFSAEDDFDQTVIEMDRSDRTFRVSNNKDSLGSSSAVSSLDNWRRTSFASPSSSQAIQRKNKQDIRLMLEEYSIQASSMEDSLFSKSSRSMKQCPPKKRKSVRVSVAKTGLRRCQTIIVMPTVTEDDDDEGKMNLEKDAPTTEEEMKDLKRETEMENVIVRQQPLKILLDGPYGSPTRHIFHARHAVLIATGIGVTPFASILQSIMYQYRKSRHTCPNCSHKWSDPLPVSSIHLKKVDFFWLNRNQRAFEWFVNMLSELEIEQAQLQEKDRFLDIHMYITSALHRTDMKAVGLQMALDLLYKKEKRDLITGLKSRTQPGRPDWNKVFTSIAEQRKGKVTVFFCGPNELARTLHTKCDEFGFRFRKEIF